MEPRNISKHCINYGRDNHNLETCKVKKKKELIVQQRLLLRMRNFKRLHHVHDIYVA